MYLNPAWRVMWHEAGAVSVGTGPEAIHLTLRGPQEEAWLLELLRPPGASDGSRPASRNGSGGLEASAPNPLGVPTPGAVLTAGPATARLTAAPVSGARATAGGALAPAAAVSEERRRDLLTALAPALLEPDPHRSTGAAGLASERLGQDALSWAGAYGIGVNEAVHRRHRARVWLSGLDRCGLAVAFGLAAAGVGTLVVRGDDRLASTDLGTSPLRLTELGLSRAAGLGRHLSRLFPHTKLLAPVSLHQGVRGADLAIIVCRDGIAARDAARLRAAGTPVLPVVFHESGFRVGPLLLPSAPGCHACRSMAWPVLADRGAAHVPACAPETTSAVLAAALAVQSAVMVLDDINYPSTLDGSYVGTLGSAAVHFEALSGACEHLSDAETAPS